jgi:beta-lactamase class A
MLTRLQNNRKLLLRTVLPCVIFSALGFVFGYVIKPSVILSSSKSIRESGTQYTFIHPLLAVNRLDMDVATPEYGPLRNSVNSAIEQDKKSGTVTAASVYFINYGKSGSFAINASEPYDPASMLKIVIMVGYLKEADADPSILSRELVYTPETQKATESVPFAEPSSLEVGQKYSINDLIASMIAGSDNGAMNLLLANISDAYLTNVYTNLGIAAPIAGTNYTIAAKDYSLFFRVLYNATYLSRINSEKALGLLSKATFMNGLVAGMPKGTLVAHKFGEHVNGTGSKVSSVELHDCGIVYVTEGPYLLCVMTKGPTLEGLQSAILQISKLVYTDVVK